MRENTLVVENAVLPPTETKKQAHALIKSMTLPELVQRRSVLLLFQSNFVNWQSKAFAQFYDGSELKKASSDKTI